MAKKDRQKHKDKKNKNKNKKLHGSAGGDGRSGDSSSSKRDRHASNQQQEQQQEQEQEKYDPFHIDTEVLVAVTPAMKKFAANCLEHGGNSDKKASGKQSSFHLSQLEMAALDQVCSGSEHDLRLESPGTRVQRHLPCFAPLSVCVFHTDIHSHTHTHTHTHTQTHTRTCTHTRTRTCCFGCCLAFLLQPCRVCFVSPASSSAQEVYCF